MSMDRLRAEERGQVERTFAALKPRAFEPVFVTDRNEALANVLADIPTGSDMANRTSTTLCSSASWSS